MWAPAYLALNHNGFIEALKEALNMCLHVTGAYSFIYVVMIGILENLGTLMCEPLPASRLYLYVSIFCYLPFVFFAVITACSVYCIPTQLCECSISWCAGFAVDSIGFKCCFTSHQQLCKHVLRVSHFVFIASILSNMNCSDTSL